MKVAVVLFDDFETLDLFGPVEILGRLPEHFHIDYYSLDGNIKVSTQGVQTPTQRISEAEESDILLIPGGKGTRKEVNNHELINAIKSLSGKTKYVLTICTGSALLAKTSLLDGKVATSNKRAFDWVISVRQEVKWKRKARWAVDGKFYTSSGVSAGIDMTLGFIKDIISHEAAYKIAHEIEYEWNDNPDNDNFA